MAAGGAKNFVWRKWHWSTVGWISERKEGRTRKIRNGLKRWRRNERRWWWSGLTLVVTHTRESRCLVASLFVLRACISSFVSDCAQVRQRRVHGRVAVDLNAVACNICQCKRTAQGWRSPPTHAGSALSIVIIYYKTAKRPTGDIRLFTLGTATYSPL